MFDWTLNIGWRIKSEGWKYWTEYGETQVNEWMNGGEMFEIE